MLVRHTLDGPNKGSVRQVPSTDVGPASVPPSGRSPISRLPPELLLAVFSHFQSLQAYDRYMAGGDWETCPNWIVILQVCHLWRTLAFGCSSLWSTIDFANFSWAVYFLETANTDQPFGLAVFIKKKYPDFLHMARLGSLHANRLRNLCINADRYQEMQEAFEYYRTTPAPQLESLTLGAFRTLPGDDRNGMDFWGSLFAGQIPQLRTLCISSGGMMLSFKLPIFQNLVHLDVKYTDLWEEDTMESFVSALAKLQGLEVLKLCWAIPRTIPTLACLPSPKFVAHFPRLRMIELDDNVFRLNHFLQYLSWPPSTAVHMCHDLLPENELPLKTSLDFISTSLPRFTTDPRTPIVVTVIRTGAAFTMLGKVENDRDAEEQFNFSVGCVGQRFLYHEQILDLASRRLPLSQTLTLEVVLRSSLPVGAYQPALRAMHRVQELVLEERLDKGLLLALVTPVALDTSDNSPEPAQASQNNLPLPRLEKIRLRWVSLNGRTLQHLLDTIAARKRYGAPIHTLEIEGGSAKDMTQAHVDRLRESVEQMIIDGNVVAWEEAEHWHGPEDGSRQQVD
ncbi:hypothetical protein EVG20_g3896 [Dentipellis fragilis]|uniref:F-box domain-containing protein n=1 Tax=Dentipellis fragilis TaxID=205917 RepID=A0A4Y9Z2G4_9AGAM|nr:hypothetical protein EVG20_g3896 [Dentipellis fragilis]